MAHEVIGYATSPDAITMTAPASPKCVAIECFKQWNFLFAIGSPGCALYVLTTLSAGHGENLSGICKKFLRVRSRGFYSLFSWFSSMTLLKNYLAGWPVMTYCHFSMSLCIGYPS